MALFENEHGVTSIMNRNLIIYCDKEDVDLIPKTKSSFRGALWDACKMHRKVMRRVIGFEPDVVNHISHLEYDNRRNNLMNCDTSYNMRDIYGRSAYSVLNDCKWCQDLYLLYMTNAITPEEFLYLRLLRLSCFPSVVCKCLGQVDTQHQELYGVGLTYGLFEKYGIKVKRQWYSTDDRLFKQEPLNGNSFKYFDYNDNIFEFSRGLKENRLSLYDDLNLSSEEQLTFIDELILGEFSQVFLSHGGTRDVFREAVFDYLNNCNYRFRFLWLVRKFYCFNFSDFYIEDVENEYTSLLDLDCSYKKQGIEIIIGYEKSRLFYKRVHTVMEDAPYPKLSVFEVFPELEEALNFLKEIKDIYFENLKSGIKCDLDFERYSRIGDMLRQCIPNIADLMPTYTKNVLDWFKYKAGFDVDANLKSMFSSCEGFAQVGAIIASNFSKRSDLYV